MFAELKAQYESLPLASYENLLSRTLILDEVFKAAQIDQHYLWLSTQYHEMAKFAYNIHSHGPKMFTPQLGTKAYELDQKSRRSYQMFLSMQAETYAARRMNNA